MQLLKQLRICLIDLENEVDKTITPNQAWMSGFYTKLNSYASAGVRNLAEFYTSVSAS